MESEFGQITSAAWSPDFGINIAIGMVDKHHWDSGSQLNVHTPRDIRSADRGAIAIWYEVSLFSAYYAEIHPGSIYI